MILAKKMITKLTKALGCDGFNIVQNNGEVAGQTVFHFHMHLIPRYNGDQAGITWKPGELKDEVTALTKGESVEAKVFPAQIAFNVIADIGSPLENGYTTEEMKMQNEGRKILHLPDLLVTCTCVRVPVYRSHSIAVTVITEEPVSVEAAENAIAAFDGDLLVTDYTPTPLENSDKDIVQVGRLRRDLTNPNGLTLWCTGDQIRKGAATNAVQIMEYLENNK